MRKLLRNNCENRNFCKLPPAILRTFSLANCNGFNRIVGEHNWKMAVLQLGGVPAYRAVPRSSHDAPENPGQKIADIAPMCL
jgi:hypothetical protein